MDIVLRVYSKAVLKINKCCLGLEVVNTNLAFS